VQRTSRAVLALCLVVAGCSGPPGTPTPDGAEPTPTITPSTPSPSPEERPEVAVEGGTLPVDATAVWQRFLDLRGLDPDDYRPPVVEVRSLDTRTVTPVIRGLSPAFLARLGFTSFTVDPDDVDGPRGGIGSGGEIVVRPNGGSPDAIERVLVHEFEHYVQPETILASSESATVERPVREGAATYVEAAYADRYLDGPNVAAMRESRYLNATHDGAKLRDAIYHYGYRYVDGRIDSPTELDVVYEDPPRRSGQLLHGHDWDEFRPLPVENGDSWVARSTAAGEHVLRTTLATELNESTAASAAGGWANDTVVGPRNGSGHVWVIRTVDEANASELGAAVRQYLDARATKADGVWRTDDSTYRVERVDAATVALVVGTDAFVGRVAVSETEGTVVISGNRTVARAEPRPPEDAVEASPTPRGASR
jgi:hypothetical protein